MPILFGGFLSFRTAITLLAFQSHPASGTATILGISFLFVFVAWTVSDRTALNPDQPRSLRWIVAYLAMALMSVAWSFTDSYAISLAYWLGLAADVLTIYLLVTPNRVQETCHQVLLGFVGGAAMVGAVAWLLPTLSDLRIGDEEFLHPNALGYILALATIAGLHLARSSHLAGLLTAFCGLTLLRTISKANIAGCAIAAAYYLLRASHLSRRAKVAIYAATALTIVLGWSLVEAYVDLYDRSSHIETLTGRTVIWGTAWEEALRTPWVGHGFYSFRFVIPVLGDFTPWQAHNELLQQFFCYGLLGVFVFALLYWKFWRFLYERRESEWFPVGSAMLLFALIRGVADTERFDLNFPLWLMTLFIGVMGREGPRSTTT